MNDSAAASAIISLLAIAGLWYVAFYLYPKTAVDHFRQKMFDLRDEMFDFAASGKIDFSHPAYGLLRSTMNGFIRFGDRIGPEAIAFVALTTWDTKPEHLPSRPFEERFSEAIADLDISQQREMKQFRDRMHLQTARHMFFGSALSFALILPLFIWIVIPASLRVIVRAVRLNLRQTFPARRMKRKAERKFVSRLERPLDKLDTRALAFGTARSSEDLSDLLVA